MSRLRIGVDLDGVLAEPMTVWCDLYSKRHDESLSLEDIRAWEVWKVVKISRDEFFRTLDDAWLKWERIPATEEDVAQQVKLLREFGTVDVVTGRSLRTVGPAKEWLKTHSIPYDRFVRTESTLAKIHLDYDVFVDDSPRLMELIASRSIALGILYTRPWNRDVRTSSVIRRVTRWAEIPPIVRAASEAASSMDGWVSRR
ncbi:5' nucleotidase, NT5C type [[Eubacterium] cellulosolvens]